MILIYISARLDAYQGLFYGREKEVAPESLPIIHCHCFSKEEDCEADILKVHSMLQTWTHMFLIYFVQRAEEILGTKLGDNLVKIHRVRDVAPKKEMLCISFKLPEEIAYSEPKRYTSYIMWCHFC
jgi:tRNA (guanine37-N1)-methyltransferase